MDAEAKPNSSASNPSAPRMVDVPPVQATSKDSAENPATTAVKNIPAFLAELKAYAAYFTSAKTDAAKAKVRSIIVYAALGVVGLLVLAGVFFAGMLLFLAGLANGLGVLFGGRVWLGQIIVGALALGAVVVCAWIGLKRYIGASRRRTEQKYEGKRTEQRAEFGRDVQQRAEQARR